MKNLLAFTLTLLLAVSFTGTHAQSDDRTKILLTVMYHGKSIVADVNSVSTTLSRAYNDAPPAAGIKDTSKTKNELSLYKDAALYLSLDIKNISDELFQVLAGKKEPFDGTITIIDNYGKKPTRTIKFKQASLYSYNDQFSTASYNDSYGTTAISIICKEASINGITFEQ